MVAIDRIVCGPALGTEIRLYACGPVAVAPSRNRVRPTDVPEAPVGPVGPVAPVGPVDPVGPVAPVGPVEPVGPVGPVAPVGPVGPVGPVAPVGPVMLVETGPASVHADPSQM